MSLPRIPITSPEFRYTKAIDTNVRVTFAKARRRVAQEQKRENVVPIKRELKG